jgi:protein-tyrosine-phosphatase
MQQNKKENNWLVLFICKANVWRSQIAEWIYNKIHWGWSISLAWNEARKRKYKSKPLKDIVHFLKLRKSLDISNQRISYLKDIPDNILSKIRIVYFLYDPNNESSCDNPCKKDWLSPYVYFKKVRVPIFIYPIDDPFDIWKGWYNFIYQEIYNLISNLK